MFLKTLVIIHVDIYLLIKCTWYTFSFSGKSIMVQTRAWNKQTGFRNNVAIYM